MSNPNPIWERTPDQAGWQLTPAGQAAIARQTIVYRGHELRRGLIGERLAYRLDNPGRCAHVYGTVEDARAHLDYMLDSGQWPEVQA